ncbi:translocon-associated protein subunit beta [Folsomia candida]|uniref:Translocon-associated protein subunit beta n=2 Tax=Folsomia candida TaxID=158441 RepID=A0A226EP68_FOLCA|nr:translocon-associated protein subunit beta [Folsomia candida]XP_021944287.1 translocon-associated protein subunit beta [Folsomia candida]OXA59422.1 Translocon-associated protein subunit beta [Folsomia candida]
MMRREGLTLGVLTAISCVLLSSMGYAADPGTLTTSEDPARVLVYKQLQNKYVVESMDVVIKYSLYNVGSVTATNVQLKDPSFGPDFTVVGGTTEVTFPRIPPASNVTHTLVVRPTKFGYYNFTAAQVTYKSGDDAPEVFQGWSSEPGEGYIAAFREFDKRFSPHFLDWTAFAIMSVPPLVIPFMLWHSSKSRYEAVLLGKKSK